MAAAGHLDPDVAVSGREGVRPDLGDLGGRSEAIAAVERSGEEDPILDQFPVSSRLRPTHETPNAPSRFTATEGSICSVRS